MSHISVLLSEAIAGLEVQEGKKYIDATFGSGGHSREIIRLGGEVLAIDTDKTTVFEGRLVHGNFRNLEAIAKEEGFDQVSGILFDLGFSSNQLEDPKRGISYRNKEAYLDMRLDQSQGETAADIINRATEKELYEILATFGEEQLARPIAHALFFTRGVKKIQTVQDVVREIEKLVGDDKRRFGVLSRVFQALRIVVNDELESLRRALRGSEILLEPGGKLVVISFHSLEDRIVKQFIRGPGWQVITKHPIIPDREEQEKNSRSRSAKLRIAKRI